MEEDGAAQADSALFRPPLRLISRVSISRGWERFGERERVSYFSLEASPYNCYCVLTRRHKRVGMTLTSKVHIKELDHTEMKFLPFFTHTHIVLNPFFLSFFLSFFHSVFLSNFKWNIKGNILKIVLVIFSIKRIENEVFKLQKGKLILF